MDIEKMEKVQWDTNVGSCPSDMNSTFPHAYSDIPKAAILEVFTVENPNTFDFSTLWLYPQHRVWCKFCRDRNELRIFKSLQTGFVSNFSYCFNPNFMHQTSWKFVRFPSICFLFWKLFRAIGPSVFCILCVLCCIWVWWLVEGVATKRSCSFVCDCRQSTCQGQHLIIRLIWCDKTRLRTHEHVSDLSERSQLSIVQNRDR